MTSRLMTKSRFAFYLLPPYAISCDIAEIQSMLEKQFGFKAAGRFQVHCTIKGFFKKNPGALEPLIYELDALLKDEKPIKVEINGIVSIYNALVLDLSRLGNTYNLPFAAFRQRVVETIRPHIAPDCDFIQEDLGNPFMGHITLAFRDCPEQIHKQVLSWLESAPIPKGAFVANTFHLLEFFAEKWDGPWWETLTWKLHKSWLLT